MSSTTVSMPNASATLRLRSSVSRIGVRLGHQQREHALGPEGRAQSAAVTELSIAAGDAHDGASPAQLARRRSCAAPRRSRPRRAPGRGAERQRLAEPASRAQVGLAGVSCFALDEADDVVDRVEVLRKELRRPGSRKSNVSSRNSTSSSTPVESITPASISDARAGELHGRLPGRSSLRGTRADRAQRSRCSRNRVVIASIFGSAARSRTGCPDAGVSAIA